MELGLSLSLTSLKGVGFSLPAFMAGQSDGFWHDFTKTDRQFQENVGATPAATANDVIGLSLSQRLWNGQTLAQVVAAAPELGANGDMSGGTTGWNCSGSFGNATLSIVSGRLRATSVDGASARIGQTAGFATVIGRTYKITTDFTNMVVGADIRVSNISTFASTLASASSGGLGTRTDALFFTATATTTYVFFLPLFTAPGQSIDIDNVTCREVSRYAATQPTGSLKPKYQTTGAAFDGLDDNLLTGYAPGAAANFIVAKGTVPATIASTQVLAGASVGASYAFLGLSTGGLIRLGTGSSLTNHGGDLRGQTVTIGCAWEAGALRAFLADGTAVSTTYSGTPPTILPLRIGANNADAVASSFFGGSIKAIVTGRQLIDLATFNKIAAAL